MVAAPQRTTRLSNLAEVERQNLYLPYLFMAGEFSFDWTPMRDMRNPYHFDPYNGTWGGLALGLRWDLDWAGSAARREGWGSSEISSKRLSKLASDWAEILALVTQVNQAKKQAISFAGGRAARKWMLSASAGFSLGTASARICSRASWPSARRSLARHLRLRTPRRTGRA